MASSIVDVWNLALLRVGNSVTVADPDETSNEARCCRILWPEVRDRFLRSFPWPWATKRANLTRAGEAPDTWASRFALPTNCLRVRSLEVPGRRQLRAEEAPSFEVAGRALLCDLEEAHLLYTARVEDVSAWDPSAIAAVSWLLASELVLALSVQKPDLAQVCQQTAARLASEAMAACANETWDQPPTCEFLSVRD